MRYATHVVRLRDPGRRPVPGLHRPGRQLPGRPRGGPAGPPEPLGDRLSPGPGAAGDAAGRHRWWASAPACAGGATHLRRRRWRRRPRSWPGSSAWRARPDADAVCATLLGLGDRVLGTGDRLPAAAHRPLPGPRPGDGPWVGGRPRRSDPADRGRRPAALAPDGVLPARRSPFPHLVWLPLWSDRRASSRSIANWFVTLFRGRPPTRLHRFLAAYVRYQTHVYAFLQLVGNPFPGFIGPAGHLPGGAGDRRTAERQNRWVTGFRLVLAIPGLPARRARIGGVGRGRRSSAGSSPCSRAGCRTACATSARSRCATAPRPSAYRPAADRPLSVQRADCAAWQPASGAARDPTADDALAWIAAAAVLWRPHARWPRRACGDATSRTTCSCAHLDPARYFSAASSSARATTSASCGSTRCCPRWCCWSCSRLYARRGERFTRESAAGRVGTGMLLAMLGFAFVWLAQLPFGLAGLWWDRRHDVSKQGYLDWAWGASSGSAASSSSSASAIADRDGPGRRAASDWWWIAAAPVFVALGAAVRVRPAVPAARTSLAARTSGWRRTRGRSRAEGPPEMPVKVEKVKRVHRRAERRGGRARPTPPGDPLGHAARRPLHAPGGAHVSRTSSVTSSRDHL